MARRQPGSGRRGDPPRRWAFTLLDANLPGIISVVEQALIEPAGDDKTVLTYVVAADVAPYMRPFVPALLRRLGALFTKGLAGIENQVARLRKEAA